LRSWRDNPLALRALPLKGEIIEAKDKKNDYRSSTGEVGRGIR
jgi:hypothetical protein